MCRSHYCYEAPDYFVDRQLIKLMYQYITCPQIFERRTFQTGELGQQM